MSRPTFALVLAGALVLPLAGCSTMGDSSSTSSTSMSNTSSGATSSGSGASSTSSAKETTVKLVTHESFVAPKELLAKFTEQTGYKVQVMASGDAGKLANSVVLAKGNPVGDVVFGVDNTFASRVVDSGALEPYTSPALPAGASTYALPGDAAKSFTPVDFGDVCVNVDDAWFAAHKKAKPNSLDDLTKPEYKNLFVTPGAATSSPGMAFLLATIAKYGDNGWQGYWKKLTANGMKVTSGWSDAWSVDYTAGGGKGSRPIVLSYNTSPADTVKNGKATTSAMSDSCFRQVEYAGVLKGAKNVAGAKAFIDFLLGKTFQASMPTNMYVFPVDSTVAVPASWKQAVTVPSKTLQVDPAKITANRDTWLREWQDAVSG